MTIAIDEAKKEIVVNSFIEAVHVMQEAEAQGKSLKEYELKILLPHAEYEAFNNQGYNIVNSKDGKH